MFHKILSATPISEYSLLVCFQNGEKKVYDVRPLLEKWEAFKAFLAVKGLFEQVKVDAGGYGVSWNDDVDLSCEELYQGGHSMPEKADETNR